MRGHGFLLAASLVLTTGCAKHYDVGMTYDEVFDRAEERRVARLVETRTLSARYELLLVPLIETDQLEADQVDYVLPPRGSGRQLRPASEIDVMIEEWFGLVLHDGVVVEVLRGEDRPSVTALAASWVGRHAD